MEFPIEILGHAWRVRCLRKDRFIKRFGKDLLGISDPLRRVIYVPRGLAYAETIAHELTHAYIAELCLHPASIGADDLEEIFCDLMAKYGGRILMQTEALVTALCS